MRKYQEEDSITMTRHYYSRDHRTFETSLDIYIPSSSTTISSIVVLVVGSAWMGHTPWIYRGTSWWNRAGPRAVAQTFLCVCVRHRGAFFHIPPVPRSISMVLLCVFLLVSWLGTTRWMTLLLFLTCLWMWLQLVGQDAASFADMQSDVEQAIQWIQQNKSNLCAQYTGGKDVPMYFGGYSSGAHVGLTVLQRPSSLSSLFQGIVLISGVLAVRPEVLSEKNHIRWLTDGILQIVFGPKDAKSIPSPIAGLIPPLPHLILGCEQEMWGLTWLNVFFCSRAYAEKARQCGIPVSYHEIVSDHWFILSHPELPKMLQRELPRLAKPSEQQ